MRQIGEGTLAIPASWHNATVNIYTAEHPGTRGPSVTVNRDRLPALSTLEDYVEAQYETLESQLPRFKRLGRERLVLGGASATLLEFTWVSQDAGEVHQLLMTLMAGQTVLNFAATSPGKMSEGPRAEMLALLRSFQPVAPAIR